MKNFKINYIILAIFIMSMIFPVIIAYNQQYITQYEDDIRLIHWAQQHSITDIFTDKVGTGYRPITNLWYLLGYNLWENNSSGYYILTGLLFSLSMILLYLIGKELHSEVSGIVAVFLYLFLDASFILVDKINFIATTGELFFITSSIYSFIKYFKFSNLKYKYVAIILSILAFLSKEPSILIVPIVVLTYLWCSGKLNKKHIFMSLIPFLYLLIIYFIISPEVSVGNSNLIERISENLKFYINTEIQNQFKTSILLLLSIIIAIYYYIINKIKSQILICSVWFIIGILPLLITQQNQEATYLAEANIGLVLLIGIIISESLKKINIISILLVIGILFQASLINIHIYDIQNRIKVVSEGQRTFLEITNEIKVVPSGESIYYISEEIRLKHGAQQLNEKYFKEYLCIQNICNVNIVNNYSYSNYIILPSMSDIDIFSKEYPEEKVNIIKHIKYGNERGMLLEKTNKTIYYIYFKSN